MGADIDLEGAVYVLVGASPAGLTADDADAFREACVHNFVKNKSAKDPEDKGLDALVKETSAGNSWRGRPLPGAEASYPRKRCSISVRVARPWAASTAILILCLPTTGANTQMAPHHAPPTPYLKP